jgi:DNA-binding transcriptional LysR family regulator
LDPTASALVNRLLARGKFRHVQVLLLLAELGSVQRTADAIGMTQSSVTQTLAALEELLEMKLFERHARGVRPLPACADLLPVARQLMTQVATSADVVVARRSQGEGMVRMVGSAAAIHGLLVDALPAFVDRHPGIHVNLREAEGEDQLLAIARGEVDVVVCREPRVIPEGWVFHPVRQDRSAIVCRATHPLARARSITAARLAQQTWLLIPAGLAARAHFDEMAAGFPHPPATYQVLSHSIPMTWWLLLQRDLLLLVPVQLARPLLEAGIVVELAYRQPVTLRSLGILQPVQGMGAASMRFSEFLRASARHGE